MLCDGHLDIDRVSGAILVLEVQRGAEAVEPPARHDRDDVTKSVCLLHGVCGQHDDTALFGLLNHVPHATAVDRVHAGGRLVEVDHLRIGDEGACHREAPAHPTRVLGARAAGKLDEVNRLEEGGDATADLGTGDSGEAGEEGEVLGAAQLGPEDVVLGADAHHRLHRAQLALDRVAKYECVTLGRGEHPREHVERGRLARPVVAQEAEESLVLDTDVDAEDGGEGGLAAAAPKRLC